MKPSVWLVGMICLLTISCERGNKDKYGIPSIWLEGDSLHFWAEEGGILGGEHWKDNGEPNRPKYPVRFTLTQKEGKILFTREGKMKKHGASSAYALHKPLKIYTSASPLHFPLFPRDNPQRQEHHTFILRNGGTFTNQYGPDIADVLLARLMKNSGLDIMSYEPVHTYVNQRYYGLHFMRERHDKYYYATNLGWDTDSLVIVRRWLNGGWGTGIDSVETEKGSAVAFEKLAHFMKEADFQQKTDWQQFQQLVDLDNFLTYIAANVIIQNNDWPHNNYKMAHPGTHDGKWRFAWYDVEFCCDSSQTGFLANLLDDEGLGDPWLVKLMAQPEFASGFEAKLEALIEGPLHPHRVYQEMSLIISELDAELDPHFQFWPEGPSRIDWEQRNLQLKRFFEERPVSLGEEMKHVF